MQYCPSGDLGSMIRKASRNRAPLHEDRIWSIFLQIVLALHYCHWPNERSNSPAALGRANGSNEATVKYQILHRDLKPENGESCHIPPTIIRRKHRPLMGPVFMSEDFVKLGDFGLSKDMGTSMFTDTYVGVSTIPCLRDGGVLIRVDTSVYAARDLIGEPLRHKVRHLVARLCFARNVYFCVRNLVHPLLCTRRAADLCTV